MSLKNIFTITVLLLPACAPAYAQICRVHNQSTSESAVTISERTYPRRDIIGDPDGTKHCQVMFRARVDNQWYDPFARYIYSFYKLSEKFINRS